MIQIHLRIKGIKMGCISSKQQAGSPLGTASPHVQSERIQLNEGHTLLEQSDSTVQQQRLEFQEILAQVTLFLDKTIYCRLSIGEAYSELNRAAQQLQNELSTQLEAHHQGDNPGNYRARLEQIENHYDTLCKAAYAREEQEALQLSPLASSAQHPTIT